MKKTIFAILAVLAVIYCYAQQPRQQQAPPAKHLLREDSAAVNAIVLYPDTIRLDIFEVCEFPASLVSIATLQKNTSSDFTNLVSSYSKDEQEDFWNLSRYPDLVTTLSQGGEKSKGQIKDITAGYPQEIQDAAEKETRKHFDVIVKMDGLQSNTNAQFEQILADYPMETQNALRDLIRYPEIISLLNDHLSLAVRVGDHYRRNPQRVIQWADSLNIAEVQQNAQSAEEWKQTMEQNPDQANDLQSAANDYAKQNGYSDDDINAAPDPGYVDNYTCTPYSYWYGYPTWYPYSYWYPYPFWFDCGFYYGPHHHMVFIGTPSYYFTNWYFYYPEHWHSYPHLADTYISHYYGPHRLATSNTVIVHNWVRDNRNYLPKDFVSNSNGRVEAIRQVAQMNVDATKAAGGQRPAAAVRDEYFKNNATKYPALSANPQNRLPAQEGRQSMPNIMTQPEKQPPVKISREQQQAPAPSRQTSHPSSQPAQQPSNYNFNKINRAQDVHRNVWQQTQPVQRQQQSAPRMQSQPMRSAPAPSGGGGGGRKR